MKSLSVSSLLSTILLFITVTTAWPWTFQNPQPIHALLPRQQSGSSSQQVSSTQQQSSKSQSQSQTQSNTNSVTSASQAKTSSAQLGQNTGLTGSAVTNSTKTSAIDPRLPPGGVSMITPAATDAMTFVKVGEQVTFVWNYTSLSVPPSYIDVVATNTVNQQSYTIAANVSYDPTATVIWDTHQYTQTTNLPFVVATYTLMIYDANLEPTAVASAGYLGSFNNYQFGIYTPQPYTPLNEFRCATCSAGVSIHEKQAVAVILGSGLITMLSFVWFAGNFGLF